MSLEQAVVQLEQTNAALQEEVVRFRDAAIGLNAIYSTITAGRQAVADGAYFSVPGNGAYMRLYRRQGSSASLIAEFPDRTELNSVINQLGPLLGRDVTSGLNSFGSDNSLVRLRDIVYASRAYFGSYYSGSSASGNVDLARAGECALYSSSNEGVFPRPGINFFWIETQSTYSGESLLQTATIYASGSPRIAQQWIRICANTTDVNGERQWGPWGEIYTSQNILGTVSQSGGVPTGAILEYGENANGMYIKLAGGLLINLIEISGSQTSANGRYEKTYPYPFVSAGAFKVAVGSEDQINSFTRRYNVNSVGTNSATTFTAYLGVGSIEFPVRYIIIGRWY
nr:hypothetical protein [uncultured Halomonas sp.]